VDKFLELPLPQRLLVVGLVLAVLGGATYYLLISSTSDEIAVQGKKYKMLMTDYAQLKEYDSPEFKEKMDKERAEAQRRRAEYSKMLPREEELPNLIESIKADADAAGLVMSSFDPARKKEEGQGYRGMPFNIEVAGTYYQLVSFLSSLAAPSKRIVTIRNLDLDLAPLGNLAQAAGDVGLLRLLLEREKSRGLSPNERYAKTVLMFEDTAKRVMLKARFTAMAYVYTGGPAGAPGGQ
jgi:type IV pilus assembly protein PilO